MLFENLTSTPKTTGMEFSYSRMEMELSLAKGIHRQESTGAVSWNGSKAILKYSTQQQVE